MSLFSTALELVVQETEHTQAEIATRAGINQPNISRYINGQMPEESAVSALCQAFPAYAGMLTVAWLTDRTPEDLRPHVSITLASGESLRVAEEPADRAPWETLPPKVRRTIECAARECERRPGFVKVLQSLIDFSSE